MRQKLLACLALAACTSAMAQDWNVIASSDNAVVYVDRASIKVTRSGTRAWVRWKFNRMQDLTGTPHQSKLEHLQVDCEEGMFATREVILYLLEDGGKVQDSLTLNQPKSRTPPPGSVGASMVEAICSQQSQGG